MDLSLYVCQYIMRQLKLIYGTFCASRFICSWNDALHKEIVSFYWGVELDKIFLSYEKTIQYQVFLRWSCVLFTIIQDLLLLSIFIQLSWREDTPLSLVDEESNTKIFEFKIKYRNSLETRLSITMNFALWVFIFHRK